MIKPLSTLLLLFFIINCGGDNSTVSSCTDCGGGLTNGFLYKEVSIEDIVSLADINVTAADVGKCIRYKLDGIDFSEATVVEDCCCVEYQ